MKTYQDLLACGQNERRRMRFISEAIGEHRLSTLYQKALTAQTYRWQENETITKYQKLLRTMAGELVPNIYTANHKCRSGFFKRFVIQQKQYLLGNGVQFKNQSAKDKLGEDFDTVLQDAADDAITNGVTFLFYDNGRVHNFDIFEFAPLYDEDNGSLRAGVRFWRIDDDKPMHVTLYEEDGLTEYIQANDKEMEVKREKRAYKTTATKAPADETATLTFENYPTFPIVPLMNNKRMETALTGLREQIDAYDLIKSGFANDLDEASMIYWLLENAGGMDEKDIAIFLERLYRLHVAVADGEDGAKATPHRIEVPYEARSQYLKQLRADLYEDAMALDTAIISAGNVTATQIEAAYEPLNEKSDDFEYQVIRAINGLQRVAGLPEETPVLTRSQMSNTTERTETVLMASQYLDDQTVIECLPFLTKEQAARAIRERRNMEINRGGVNADRNNPDGMLNNTQPSNDEEE